MNGQATFHSVAFPVDFESISQNRSIQHVDLFNPERFSFFFFF